MIAYFVYNLKGYSGASQQALLLAKSIRKPVIIFNHERNFKASVEYIDELLKVVTLPNNKLLALVYLIYFLLINRCRVVHMHGFFVHGIIISRMLRIKTILKTTLYGEDDFETLFKFSRNKWLFRLLVSLIDVNVCLTRQLLEANSSYISIDRIKLIPNGVLIPKSTLEKKDNLFCFVGLICDRKGAFESIKHFIDYYSNLDGALMYVLGPVDGLNESDYSYVERCYKLVEETKMSGKVIFTGKLSKDEVQKFLMLSKGLIFFSKKEGMPNVVLEAMANNCIPITTGIDGVMLELLGCHFYSLLTVNDDNKFIDIKTIDRLLSEREVQKLAFGTFSIDRISSQYNILYNELLS